MFSGTAQRSNLFPFTQFLVRGNISKGNSDQIHRALSVNCLREIAKFPAFSLFIMHAAHSAIVSRILGMKKSPIPIVSTLELYLASHPQFQAYIRDLLRHYKNIAIVEKVNSMLLQNSALPHQNLCQKWFFLLPSR